MDDIRKILEEIVKQDLKELRDIESNPEERKKLIEEFEKLYSIKQEDEKIEETKEARKEKNRNDYILGIIGKIGDMIVSGASIAAFAKLAMTMFKFEETGTIAASASRLIINRFGKIFK